ncbi:hypothetical protein RF094_08785, partial [Serratia marcescens]|nr:hypothetical protein [Serratia marcescens]
HANYAHHSTGAPPVDYYVDAAGDMLTHVHLQDTDGYADRHWAPGEGNIRWIGVFRALAKLSSNPRLILELRNHEHVKAGAAYLASLGVAQEVRLFRKVDNLKREGHDQAHPPWPARRRRRD